MNVFCHPSALSTPAMRQLLGIDADVELIFGHRPGIPLLKQKRDRTEVDLKMGDLLLEAKLTEFDFQTAPVRLIERYRDIGSVFNFDELEVENGKVQSYQLIRSVLAAHAIPGHRFSVLCDARRPDLIDAWYRVISAVKPYDLRCRLQIITWQELSAVLPSTLQAFLEEKYGCKAA